MFAMLHNVTVYNMLKAHPIVQARSVFYYIGPASVMSYILSFIQEGTVPHAEA